MGGATRFCALGHDNFTRRLIVLVYGRPKIGKTTLLYKLAEGGSYVYMLSTDRGTLAGSLKPPERIQVTYPGTGKSYLHDLRESILEVRERATVLSARIGPEKVWLAVDTLTHMQSQLMVEARTVNIKNPASNANRDDFVRDITTQVDWGINLTMMAEIAEAMRAVPCNICYTALEKHERDRTDHSVSVPAMSGQSAERYKGDADIIVRMTLNDQGKRILQCTPDTGYEAGGRTDRLSAVEPPDLEALRKKVLA